MARNARLEEIAVHLAKKVRGRMNARRIAPKALAVQLSKGTQVSVRYCESVVRAILTGYVRGYFPEKSGGIRSERLSLALDFLDVPVDDPLIEQLKAVCPGFIYEPRHGKNILSLYPA